MRQVAITTKRSSKEDIGSLGLIQFESSMERETYADELDNKIARLFSVDLFKKAVRQSLALRHPMLDHRYATETQEIENFRDIVFDWVISRKSGLYACGLHRQGKTTALNIVLEYLRQELPFIAFLRCDGERDIRQSKKSFCRYMLSAFGYPIENVRRDSRLETILVNLMMTACAKAGGRQCVLFIDEAQLFSVTQYRYLLEIWNEMYRNGFMFGTVLIGQPDLKTLKDLTSEADHGAVVSRFFVKEYEFGGVKSEAMLASLLTHFDSELTYPEGSAWSYSRFFLCEAFDHGWRLSTEAPLLWEVLRRISKDKASAIKISGFRMAWIIDAVHGFLLDGMAKDNRKFRGTIDMWEECLLSGTEAALVL